MKIQFRLPKVDDDSHAALIERGWIPLREPANLAVAILLSIPFMVIAALISVGIISGVSTISVEECGFTPDSFSVRIDLLIILAIILLIPSLPRLLPRQAMISFGGRLEANIEFRFTDRNTSSNGCMHAW
ncbi:MAG: hypothetical protein R6V59_00580 [Dehalococcoidia bacterium]